MKGKIWFSLGIVVLASALVTGKIHPERTGEPSFDRSEHNSDGSEDDSESYEDDSDDSQEYFYENSDYSDVETHFEAQGWIHYMMEKLKAATEPLDFLIDLKALDIRTFNFDVLEEIRKAAGFESYLFSKAAFDELDLYQIVLKMNDLKCNDPRYDYFDGALQIDIETFLYHTYMEFDKEMPTDSLANFWKWLGEFLVYVKTRAFIVELNKHGSTRTYKGIDLFEDINIFDEVNLNESNAPSDPLKTSRFWETNWALKAIETFKNYHTLKKASTPSA